VERLRGEPEVRHHRHLGAHQRGRHLRPIALDLHRLRAALLDEDERRGDGLLRPEVERAERHVADQ
jgi:hypothetical protein